VWSTAARTADWDFAYCQFLSGALLDRLGIPVSIALVRLGIFAFAHAKT
jgi:hypothetical protein